MDEWLGVEIHVKMCVPPSIRKTKIKKYFPVDASDVIFRVDQTKEQRNTPTRTILVRNARLLELHSVEQPRTAMPSYIIVWSCVLFPSLAWALTVGPRTAFPTRPSTLADSRLWSSDTDNTNEPIDDESAQASSDSNDNKNKKQAIVIGAGWGGLSAAYHLAKQDVRQEYEITVIDAAPRIGGLVRDGFTSMTGKRPAEAGQHGFWDQYYNIFQLLDEDLGIVDQALTGYAEQGQYSKHGGLEAIWPVYRNQQPKLPTGLAQAVYTKFQNLPIMDRLTAFPLVLAFSEFDDSEAAWKKYDTISFRDLCIKLGVSKRCYDEAFEPMILTGLFAPGSQVSAAAALGMAYFFVLSNQQAFDVRWCKGNIGEAIFDPWMRKMQEMGVRFQTSTRVDKFDISSATRAKITNIQCSVKDPDTQQVTTWSVDNPSVVVFATGAAALNGMVRNNQQSLARLAEFRRFANLRGTSVLATRLYLDKEVKTPYTANACWGFDQGVGMTFFNIGELHQRNLDEEEKEQADGIKTILEVDYYHANSLLVMSDDEIVEKVKSDLDTMLGASSKTANVVDAAVVRLPNAVNWYYPDSYKDMPDLKSESLSNAYFAGDLVKTRHGSWSQEKAYVTGMEVSNLILKKPQSSDIIPLPKDELHVAFGRSAVSTAQKLLGLGDPSRAPSLADFFF